MFLKFISSVFIRGRFLFSFLYNLFVSIAENVTQIRERLARAAAKVGRDPESITLMAVSKTVEPERIKEAYAAWLVFLARIAYRNLTANPPH